jgi:3-oxoacyl-[acyl-carrier protein] reductase
VYENFYPSNIDNDMTNSSKPLQGQVALITGSVRRIGRATALELSRLGASIVINARSSLDEAQAVKLEIENAGGQALVCIGDIRDEATVEAMMAQVMARFGRLDILVNNASIRADSEFLSLSLTEWREVTSIILDGAFLCSRAALPHILKTGAGRIVNIGGVSAKVGAADRAHVVTAKAGIEGFTRALAHEFSPRGVTVNCVVPGKIGGKRSATSGKGIEAKVLTPREGEVEDVARMVAYLCLPESGYVTGQSFNVNGGMYMS